MVTREERKTHVLDGLELGVVLVVRIAKVLNFSHRELTNTKKTTSALPRSFSKTEKSHF